MPYVRMVIITSSGNARMEMRHMAACRSSWNVRWTIATMALTVLLMASAHAGLQREQPVAAAQADAP